MNKPILVIIVCAVMGLLLTNSDHPPKPVAASQGKGYFDYGDGVGKAPKPITEPIPPFEATPPREPVGATPVIDGVESVAQADVSAFSDVPLEPVPGRKEPVAAVPPVPVADPPQSAFSDVKPEITQPSQPVASAPGNADWTKNVFSVRSGNDYGTAVSVAPDTLLTVHHVARFATAQVEINGQWVTANVQHPPGADDGHRDGAILKVTSQNLPSLQVRAPAYYEPVTIYGLKTKTLQRGFVASARTVSLTPENKGILSGDSGCAVVADDGSLVGIGSGHESQVLNVPANPRVVGITRLDFFLPYLPRQGMQSTQGGVPQPVGSAFPDGQPSAFDPPPAVNSNRANCAAPMARANCSTPAFAQAPVYASSSQVCDAYGNCTVPQQTYQVQTYRGLFGVVRQRRVR